MMHSVMVVRYQEKEGGRVKTGIIIEEEHIVALDGSIPKEIWDYKTMPFEGCMQIDDGEKQLL